MRQEERITKLSTDKGNGKKGEREKKKKKGEQLHYLKKKKKKKSLTVCLSKI